MRISLYQLPKYAIFFKSKIKLFAYYTIEVNMREIALATKARNREIIDFLHANIQAKIDFCKTIITRYNDNDFSYLLFACEEKFIEPCEAILREVIVDYIESIYKLNYLKHKIKNPLSNSLAFNAYIKVLALFDKSTDETALNKILIFNQSFFVDSFLEFRLNPLKKHWNNLAELSSDNLMMFNSSTFIDIIRFLINTMDNLVYKIKVICDSEHFSIYIMKNKNEKIQKIAECKNSTELITNVLNSCPNYIDIYINDNNNYEAVSFLSNVFANRLKIFMKN